MRLKPNFEKRMIVLTLLLVFISSGMQRVEAATFNALVIDNRNVFNESMAAKNGIARLVNRLNWRTQARLVERVFWLQTGDAITAADAQALQRKLRSLDIFSAVEVTLVPLHNAPDKVNVHVVTQDRATIRFGASSEYVGGVAEVRFNASELNLFGIGDAIAYTYEEDSQANSRQALSYTDLHIANGVYRQSMELGQTQAGDFASYQIERPFRFQRDTQSWQLAIKDAAKTNISYEGADEIASQAYQDSNIRWHYYWRTPKPLHENTITQGIVGRYDAWQYGELSGSDTANITTPNDFKRLFWGYYYAVEQPAAYETLMGLDTLIFPQDIALSSRHELVLGVSQRRDIETSYQPEWRYQFETGRKVCNHCYLSATLNNNMRLLGDDVQQSEWRLTLNSYWLGAQRHKFATRLQYDSHYVADSFAITRAIGEETGLRGYANNTDSGTKRVIINLEDRILSDWQYATIRLGFITFYDVAWVADRGESFNDAYQSVGIGLRFGSKKLFGRNIVRIDISFPLDGDDNTPLLSIATGQLFTF